MAISKKSLSERSERTGRFALNQKETDLGSKVLDIFGQMGVVSVFI